MPRQTEVEEPQNVKLEYRLHEVSRLINSAAPAASSGVDTEFFRLPDDLLRPATTSHVRRGAAPKSHRAPSGQAGPRGSVEDSHPRLSAGDVQPRRILDRWEPHRLAFYRDHPSEGLKRASHVAKKPCTKSFSPAFRGSG